MVPGPRVFTAGSLAGFSGWKEVFSGRTPIATLPLVFSTLAAGATPDVVSEFPALAARELGLGDVPLMCSVEMDVAGAMPRVIRLMMHVETKKQRSEISHIYLRGAQALRTDLAQ